MTAKMNASEFKKRLAALCTRGGYREWPRKPLEEHVLMKSAVLMLEPGREYGEQELNEPLQTWIEQVGQSFMVDYASLRRFLVDAGYVTRDSAGQRYRLDEERAAAMFEADVATVDPVHVVQDALRQIEERKQAYLKKGKDT